MSVKNKVAGTCVSLRSGKDWVLAATVTRDAVRRDEVAKAWGTVRGHLRESAGVRLFDQWLKPIELVEGSDSDTVRLALPSAFMTNWVRNHYADRLFQEFRSILPDVRSVSIK